MSLPIFDIQVKGVVRTGTQKRGCGEVSHSVGYSLDEKEWRSKLRERRRMVQFEGEGLAEIEGSEVREGLEERTQLMEEAWLRENHSF